MFTELFAHALIGLSLILVGLGTVSLLALLYRDYANDAIW